MLAIGYFLAAKNLAMRFAVEAVSSPPTVTSNLTLFLTNRSRLKSSSKFLSDGLKRLIVRNDPPRLKMSSASRKSISVIFGVSVNKAEYPPCSPSTRYPFCKNVFATLPTTVFIPGAGPPPVKIAIASISFILKFKFYRFRPLRRIFFRLSDPKIQFIFNIF